MSRMRKSEQAEGEGLWPEWSVVVLTEQFNLGLSAREISRHLAGLKLSKSRCAVLAKLDRLGLKRQVPPKSSPKAAGRVIEVVPKPGFGKPNFLPKAPVGEREVQALARLSGLEAKLARGGGKTLYDLAADECHGVVGESPEGTLFCGVPGLRLGRGRVYCAACRQLMVDKTPAPRVNQLAYGKAGRRFYA